MDCAATEAALIDYHFAVISEEGREGVHAHLRGCLMCSRRYLELKYAIDSGAALQVRPSSTARSRLRAEVATLFPPTRGQRVQKWLTRPVPRYQVAATMACMLLIFGVGFLASGRAPAPSSAPVLAQKQDTVDVRDPRRSRRSLHHSFEAVDSARPMAVSLTYY